MIPVGDGEPQHDGLYVVYTNGPTPTTTERQLAFFMNGRWSHPKSDQKFRAHIYEWIGPLPVLRLEP